jgi:hypothetical protein
MESEVVYYDNSEGFIKTSLAKFKDEDVIPRLAKIVSTGRSNAKMLALEILCERKSPDSEAIFKEAISDENPFIREIAISGLASIGNESIIPTLVKPLFDKDRTVRDTAIRAFGKIGGDGSFKMLTELFKENWTGSFGLGTIAKALGDIGREESIDLLISKLDKEDETLSADIIEALGSIGGDKAIRTLLQLLNDKELDISDKVSETLTDLVQADRNLPILTQQLPHLRNLISTEASQQALSVITAIQARCKYYNYKIYDTPLQETENNADPVEYTLNELTKAVKKMSDAPKYDLRGAKIDKLIDNIGVYNENNFAPEQKQNLADAAKEIQDLLDQLAKTYPSATEAEAKDIVKATFEEIKTNHPDKWKILWTQILNPERWLNGGKAALSETAKHYAENSVILKVTIAFFDGFSADEE